MFCSTFEGVDELLSGSVKSSMKNGVADATKTCPELSDAVAAPLANGWNCGAAPEYGVCPWPAQEASPTESTAANAKLDCFIDSPNGDEYGFFPPVTRPSNAWDPRFNLHWAEGLKAPRLRARCAAAIECDEHDGDVVQRWEGLKS